MLYDCLFDRQKSIVDNFKNRKAFGLFLDMGLGKTPISLSFAEQHKSDKIMIVSIGKKVLEDEDVEGSFFYWIKKMEIQYNLYNKKNNFIKEGPKKYQAKVSPETKDVFLINYEHLFKRSTQTNKNNKKCVLNENVEEFVLNCKNNKITMILDESHKVKELDSLQTLAIKKIYRTLCLQGNEVYLYLLTGTPFTQGFIDLYSQLKLLGWEGNKEFFKDSFCVTGNIPGLLGRQQPIVGYKNVNELYNLIHNFALTIKSKEVIKLPEQVFVYHKIPKIIEMDLISQEKIKKSILEKYIFDNKISLPYPLEETKQDIKINNPFYRNIAFPSLEFEAEQIGVFWARCRQLSIGFQGNSEYDIWYNDSRLKELKKLLEENPDNYVLFYNYDPEFYKLFDLCNELGYKIDVYNGNIKSEFFYNKYQKQSSEERLINTKNIILSNFKSGSAGGNWQAYNKCILFSLPLFGDYEQSIKRVHRIGQKETVIYHIFYNDNFLDKGMLTALKENKEYNKELFESDLNKIQSLLKK